MLAGSLFSCRATSATFSPPARTCAETWHVHGTGSMPRHTLGELLGWCLPIEPCRSALLVMRFDERPVPQGGSLCTGTGMSLTNRRCRQKALTVDSSFTERESRTAPRPVRAAVARCIDVTTDTHPVGRGPAGVAGRGWRRLGGPSPCAGRPSLLLRGLPRRAEPCWHASVGGAPGRALRRLPRSALLAERPSMVGGKDTG